MRDVVYDVRLAEKWSKSYRTSGSTFIVDDVQEDGLRRWRSQARNGGGYHVIGREAESADAHEGRSGLTSSRNTKSGHGTHGI